ncbi:MAG: LysR family transcriptional regulator [Thiothrix sp.]|nr:LysR family transcriptional regulator [Thiothrix sp.]HPE59030.1 LysR family transcriptional regulator [Thiolinea sp.]
MDIAHLKTFLEIYRLRHFGRAAEKLYISQSAASARIKLLEERLGVRLFERTPNGVTPTLAGQRFRKYAETMLTSWEQARQLICLPETFQQSLSLGCQLDIWQFWLQHRFNSLRDAMADTAFTLSTRSEPELIEQVINGSLDLALVFEPRHVPALLYEELDQLVLQLLATRGELDIGRLQEYGYILVDWGATFLFEHAQQLGETLNAAMIVNSGMMACDILQGRDGAAYLPRQLAGTAVSRFQPVAGGPEFRQTIFAVCRHDSRNAGLTRHLTKLIRTGTPESSPRPRTAGL